MSKFVDELHNKEDATNFRDALLFFAGLISLLATLGIIFWSSF